MFTYRTNKLITTLLVSLFFASASFAEKIKVAIVDSGVDFTHKDLSSKAFKNPEELLNSKDDDKNGYIDDINGWNLADNNNKVLDLEYFQKNEKTYKSVQRAYVLLSKIELGQPLTLKEKAELVALVVTKMGAINAYGTLIHGTHCAGIASKENDKAEILGVKMGFGGEAEKPVFGIPSKEVLEKYISEALAAEAEFFKTMIKFLQTQNIRVINASWGANEALAAGMFKAKFPEMPPESYAQLAKYYMTKAEKVYAYLPENSPDALWVIAAGNDGSNNDEIIDWPANLRYPNTISVAAVDGNNLLAKFSNYGLEKVDVAAPGVQIESTIPMDSYTRMSGTSMAAPYVTKVSSLVVAANPSLKPEDVRKILMGTVDKKGYLANKVKSGGIVNLKRAVAAAEATLENAIEEAITKSFEMVPRVKAGSYKGDGFALSFKEKLNGFSDTEKELINKLYEMILKIN